MPQSLLSKLKHHVMSHIHMHGHGLAKSHIKHMAHSVLNEVAKHHLHAHPKSHAKLMHAHASAQRWIEGKGFWDSVKSFFGNVGNKIVQGAKYIAPYAKSAFKAIAPVLGQVASTAIGSRFGPGGAMAANALNGLAQKGIAGLGLKHHKKGGRLVKGSAAAKAHMAKIRSMKSGHGVTERIHRKKRGCALSAMGY